MVDFLINILSLLTILLDVFILGVILLWGSSYFYQPSKNWLNRFIELLDSKEILLGFIIALVATSGSLFYSEIASYTPCELCWYQRILMYPQVLILGMAMWKKDKNIADYSILLSILGGIIATYHYIIQFVETKIVPCSAVGYSVSCSDNFVLDYGYITIPMMALSAFVAIIILMLFLKFNSNKGFLDNLMKKITGK